MRFKPKVIGHMPHYSRETYVDTVTTISDTVINNVLFKIYAKQACQLKTNKNIKTQRKSGTGGNVNRHKVHIYHKNINTTGSNVHMA